MLPRLFSFAYRKANKQKARGNYEQAAAHFAEAGDANQAALMLGIVAKHASDAQKKVSTLERALSLVDDPDLQKNLAAQLGVILFDRLSQLGVHTQIDRENAVHAGEILQLGEYYDKAATAFQMADRQDLAVSSLRQGGLVDKLEDKLLLENSRAKHDRSLRQRFSDYTSLLATGQRKAALSAIEQCISLALDGSSQDASQANTYRTMTKALTSQQITDGILSIQDSTGNILTIIGHEKINLGRDISNSIQLFSPAVSRKHLLFYCADDNAEMPSQVWMVESASSAGKTLLDKNIVDQPTALPTNGNLTVGGIDISFSIAKPGHLTLSIFDGEKPRLVWIVPKEQSIYLPMLDSGWSTPLPSPQDGSASLQFCDGVPILSTKEGLLLNKNYTTGNVELIHGDTIVCSQREFTIV